MTHRAGMNAVRTDQRENRLFGLPSPVDGLHGRVEIDPSGLNRFREPMRGGATGLEGVVDATPIFLLLVDGLVVGRGAHEDQPDTVAVKTFREHAHAFDVALDAFRFGEPFAIEAHHGRARPEPGRQVLAPCERRRAPGLLQRPPLVKVGRVAPVGRTAVRTVQATRATPCGNPS